MRSAADPQGITFLDHTADVGLAVTAPTLPDLFSRTALGMTWLIHGLDRGDDAGLGGDASARERLASEPAGSSSSARPGEDSERTVDLAADDLPTLLRAWLREVLHWHELEGLSLREVRFSALSETRLEAEVTLAPEAQEPIREIKGVTLHGLVARPGAHGWESRVIFDV